MSVYSGKIIELAAIEQMEQQTRLRLRLLWARETEFLWNVDAVTAENLLSAVDFDEIHKYRLSLHTSYDPIRNRHFGSVTQTYREQSDRVSFACSEEYKRQLEALRHAGSMEELFALPFLWIEQQPDEAIDTQPIRKEESKVAAGPRRRKAPVRLASIAVSGILFVALFSYSHEADLDQTELSGPPAAKTGADAAWTSLEPPRQALPPVPNVKPVVAEADREASEADTEAKTGSETGIDSGAETETETERKELPYYELKNLISYSLPQGYVALTFDDGPSRYSRDLADILKTHDAGGTFFYIGLNVNKHPDAVRYVHENGFSIGTHSANHTVMSDLPHARQVKELVHSTQAIEKITGEPVALFRPPYGAFNESTQKAARLHDLRMVLWNKDTQDWHSRSADKIFNYVKHIDASGSIILLHESKPVIEALPRIIEHLQAQGLEIVSLR